MALWPLDDPGCEQIFRERFRRPPPWFEIAPLEDLQSLAWSIGQALGMKPPSMSLRSVARAAWDALPRPESLGPTGSPEPLQIAGGRLGIPPDGAVWLWRWDGGTHAAHLRTRDVIEFEQVLWWDDTWLIDDAGGWLLFGPHERKAGWIDLRGRRENPSADG